MTYGEGSSAAEGVSQRSTSHRSQKKEIVIFKYSIPVCLSCPELEVLDYFAYR
jgi:hypothetical protein